MFKKIFLPIVLVVILCMFPISCDKTSTGPDQGSGGSTIYGGASPIGDYIAVTVDAAGHTVTYHNYTTSESAGPFTYSQVTSNNWGFQNLYKTQNFEVGPGDSCYAEFIIMHGVALTYQLFKAANDSAIDWPVYALSRTAVNMNNLKGQAFNWMNFKINEAEGNFEAGFAAFDTDIGGLLYGAAYNNRAEREGWGGSDMGMKKINDYDSVKTSAFTYNASLVANTLSNLTLIGTESGDFITDFGAGKGAGFAVRQASSKNWSPNYNGTYFTLIYENRNTAAAPTEQTVQPMRLVASNGTVSAAGLQSGNSIVPVYSGTFANFEDFTGGPHSPTRTAVQDFQYFSRCDTAQSITVRNAYNCHGGFIDASVSDQVITLFFDPEGKFLFFCMFERDDSGTMNYRFGFGIKDPNYVEP
jgi:hypothetical protein